MRKGIKYSIYSFTIFSLIVYITIKFSGDEDYQGSLVAKIGHVTVHQSLSFFKQYYLARTQETCCLYC